VNESDRRSRSVSPAREAGFAPASALSEESAKAQAGTSRNEELVDQVKDRYGKIAEGKIQGCGSGVSPCCGGPSETNVAESLGYSKADLEALPDGANLGLGCGAPVDHLNLMPGERVLDLGSGAGIDVFLAAKRVGPTGHVIGVDMTPEMLDKARAHARKLGLLNVEFREGRLERLPLDDASVDAVTSNCVINLVPDKAAVFREIARVLRPGGRLVISDIVLNGRLPAAIQQDVYAYVGCVSGALPREAYFAALGKAGLGDVDLLRDIDYLGAFAQSAPEQLDGLLQQYGIPREQVTGVVHSVTYRARKAASASCCAPACCDGTR
jgi:SAM-dependent methyltransferase